MTTITRGLTKAVIPRTQCRFASSATKSSKRTSASKPSPSKPTPRPYKPTPPKPAAQPSSTSAEPQTLLSVWRRSWLPLTGAALLAGALGFYIFGTVAASLKQCPCQTPCEHSSPTGRPPALTGDNAEQFDKELNLPEWWMGITKLRKKLAEHARGDVLELAMGSGRNLEYYNWEHLAQQQSRGGPSGITSFTGLDISVDMLDVARRKLVRTVPPMASSATIVKAASMPNNTGGQLSFLDDKLRLVHSDAHNPLPPPPVTSTATATKKQVPSTDAKYDTIVQTFGLCSVSDPVAVISNLATTIKADSGRIILLEHGKGWYGIVNGLLDKNAGKHFEKYGCWWNRDIEAIVEDAVAANPGLEVVSLQRPNVLQMGTLVWVELKMRDNKAVIQKD